MKLKLHKILALVLAISCVGPAVAQDADPNDPVALLATVQSADATLHAKAIACKKLAFYGTPDAIPVLAALLPDEKLSHYARFALEGIPDKAAAAALRESTKTLTGRQLVGVVGSLGSLRDEASIELLGELLKNEDTDVVIAAASSLGKIGNEAALNALIEGDLRSVKVDAIGKRALADACIECSERLASQGVPRKLMAMPFNLALGLYPDAESVPPQIKAAVIRAMTLTITPGEKHLALRNTLLHESDSVEVEIGLRIARELKTEQAAEVLVDIFADASPSLKIQLVRFYGEMGDDYPLLDKRVDRLLSAVGSKDLPILQFEAAKALAALGDVIPEDSQAIDTLLGLIASEDDSLQTIVIDTLSRQSSKSIDAKLLAKFDSAEASIDERCATIELIGKRRIAGVTPRLASLAATASDGTVRLAAVRALGETIALDDIDRLLNLYSAFQADETSADVYKQSLQAACIRMADLDATVTRLAAWIVGKPAETQVFILDRIGELGGAAALTKLGELAIKGEPHLQDAATRILGGWMMPDGAPVLLELAKTHPAEKYRIRTLRGFIRIVRQLRFADDQRLAYIRAALEVATRPDEKKLAIETLTRVVSIESMNIAIAYLADPAVKQQAAKTIVKLAGSISEKTPEPALDALKKVIAAGVDAEMTKQAQLLIARIEQRQ